ncbi:MAG: sterol desaturase family protein [Rhodospirillaceae bacterium]|nr:sterol desaturase family protein [Rhodospirillaceae bacterium]MYB13280.1 sterol desaturase family protein [Rhodospirillaceae bacterium]MYI50981.1 sterol desaturase family protein [Rhodospirillaceae bacterium]
MAVADDRGGEAPASAAAMSFRWNWHPPVPLAGVPYWDWPPRPLAVAHWLVAYFTRPSDRTLFLIFALFVGLWLQPVDAAQSTLSAGWPLEVLLRNVIALAVVAGGLHLWFHTYRVQESAFEYDRPDAARRRGRRFFLGHQTWDNMFWTMVYAAPVATAWELLARVMYARGVFTGIGFAEHPVVFVLLFPLLTLWQSAHFFVIHRALHWKPLYRWVHAVHHRNVSPTPWSGLAMHPVEHVLYFSSLAIFFLLPSHPVHMLFLLFWQLLGAPSGHSGFDALSVAGRRILALDAFFHHLHHRHFECNYGSGEFPLDRWLRTGHDGTGHDGTGHDGTGSAAGNRSRRRHRAAQG